MESYRRLYDCKSKPLQGSFSVSCSLLIRTALSTINWSFVPLLPMMWKPLQGLSNQSKYIPNWKAPGRDGVQGYWIKKLNSRHGRLAGQLNEILNGDKQLPEWMTYGTTMSDHMSSTQVAVCHHSKFHSIALLNDHVRSSVSLSSTPVPHPYQVPSNWGYIYFDWIPSHLLQPTLPVGYNLPT